MNYEAVLAAILAGSMTPNEGRARLIAAVSDPPAGADLPAHLRSEIVRLRTALEQIHDIAAMGTRNTAAWQEVLEITNVTLTTQGRGTP